jgi:hypothetical protein
MDGPATRGVRDGVGAAGGVKLVQEPADVELGVWTEMPSRRAMTLLDAPSASRASTLLDEIGERGGQDLKIGVGGFGHGRLLHHPCAVWAGAFLLPEWGGLRRRAHDSRSLLVQL